jgi:hypothetical protein
MLTRGVTRQALKLNGPTQKENIRDTSALSLERT